jgi:phosphoglycolate phosphatase-like HAD superfamily hydrolase
MPPAALVDNVAEVVAVGDTPLDMQAAYRFFSNSCKQVRDP